ncbi:amidase [Streptomyces tirandamycinicus]|uniref:amidase n=1 Tax=Streptomyces tirandamycinicus TaxID=2174846 RepID=UPI00226E6A0E|nr:amidase [Streptomyces tirandamycinicus]MCY0980527.1 amidase [Streptomyces tirandamycinicus]
MRSADDTAVWRERGDPLVAGAGTGRLRGLRLAVKDIHAIAGYRIGAGNPARLAEAEPRPRHSWAVAALLDAGADVEGIAQTDEFAYSLNGTNAHYGTPPNPAAPGRVPGGSSSGPASAVALGEADVGLGSDTAGSIRVPASYCGLYGLRPTHGLVPVTGMLPLAPSFDTVAWLARDPGPLARVGDVLLPEAGAAEAVPPFHTALVADDLVALAEPEVRDAFAEAAADLAARTGLRIEHVPSVGGDPAALGAAFATAQGAEVWECDGAWVRAHPGALGPGIAARFTRASEVTAERRAAAEEVVHHAGRAARSALPDDTVLLLPATGGPAPTTDETAERKAALRDAAFRLTCLASSAGLPCLVLPRIRVGGLPVGLAVIGGHATDRRLLELATHAQAPRRAL